MFARIYKPSKTAMQSGRAKTHEWVLEFEPEEAREIEPLMGWTASGDTKGQLHLHFETKEDAIAYAKRNGIPYQLFEPRERKAQIKPYADNFKFDRWQPWTH